MSAALNLDLHQSRLIEAELTKMSPVIVFDTVVLIRVGALRVVFEGRRHFRLAPGRPLSATRKLTALWPRRTAPGRHSMSMRRPDPAS